MRELRPVFWIEGLLAAATGIATLVTLVWNDWIEILFGIDADGGNGSVESLLVLLLLLATVALVAATRVEWRRAYGTSS